MGRPKTKEALLQTANETYQQVISQLDSFSPEQLEATFTFDTTNKKEAHWTRDKSLRDVLIHLHEWHQLLLTWVETNQQGKQTSFLKSGYNWRTYGEMNREFVKQHSHTSYQEALTLFKDTHLKVMTLADAFSSEELFTKGQFSWVGGSSLGSYFVSSTCSHYTWASKKIQLHKKSLTDI